MAMGMEPTYIVIDMGTFIFLMVAIGMVIGLLLTRAVKDVLAWRQWTRHRSLSRPPPVDGWKVKIPGGRRN